MEFVPPRVLCRQTYADALDAGTMTLSDVLDAVTARPVRRFPNCDISPATKKWHWQSQSWDHAPRLDAWLRAGLSVSL